VTQMERQNCKVPIVRCPSGVIKAKLTDFRRGKECCINKITATYIIIEDDCHEIQCSCQLLDFSQAIQSKLISVVLVASVKVLVAIHYSVLDDRNGYIRNVVV